MSSSEPVTLPEYAAVAAALQRCGLSQCPAELHGFALGMAVGGVPEPLTVWQHELYAAFDPNDVLANECRALLDRVFAATFIADDTMALELLLPQDIVVDSTRVGAVRDWCQGFLFGLGLAGETVAARLSSDSRELLSDFSEFTRLDSDDVDNSDANRAALIEIEEYLREGVMLIRDELARQRLSQSPQTAD
ncbi:MAG: UPF0149 family protein [Gammaproteobacteria bacterium]|nr:UPF0149 family protein [Gammaproteobacteria bacterium]